jgi:predicted Zn-dependent protease
MRFLAALPLIALLAACTTVEGTGRKQLNFYSPSDEVALGNQAYAEELKNAKILPATDARVQRVQAIGRRIEVSARQRTPGMAQRMQWSWVVVDDPKTVNAWMVPGGKACVYSGMLDFAQSDDELAVVMGHEASHAIARHGTERMSEGNLLGLGVVATEVATGSSAAGQGASAAAQYLIALPHSRNQEIEADEMGLLIAAQAGYDPRTAIPLWKRMQSQGGSPPEFLSTHPSESTRIERLQALMPQATAIWQRAKANAAAPGATSAAPRSPPR